MRKLILLCFLVLAACESAEERAERYFQSGMTLLEAGDVDRALVEFRNVFAANPRHEAARLAYADAQRGRGFVADAYGQYVRLIEQNPDHAEALIALAEIAILSDSWDEADTFGRKATALSPDDARADIVTAMLDYRAAVMAETSAAAPAATARHALADHPQSVIARKVVIDHAIMQDDILTALETVEDGLAIHPAQSEFHVLRVGLLIAGDDPARTRVAFEEMAAQFPRNPQVQQNLISWYLSRDDLPAAEVHLRRIASAPDATQAQKMTVVDFLRQTKGIDAARVELERLIASTADNAQYRVLRATILFSEGKRDAAIAELERIISADEATDNTRDFKIVLAQMLETQGETDQARAHVAQVLAADPGQVEALKMQAQWAIAADDPTSAIIVLRQALAEAPRDIDLITLLGAAHERAGDHELAGERYALAVEISRQAAAPSLRHASFLLGRSRLDTAQAVIAAALTVAPQDIELLATMAEIQLRQGRWNNVTRIIWQLRAMDTPMTNSLADRTELSLLKRQQRFDDTSALLERMIADGTTSMATKAQMVEVQIRAGRLDDARAFLKEQLATNPDDPTLRFLQADINLLMENADAAEVGYRALIAAHPENEHVLGRLYGLLVNQGRQEAADALLDDVIARAPAARMAKMVKASRREVLGDFEGAIAIYETLYAADSHNLIIANNLASLISAQRDDEASIARAYAIAARLRGTDVPQFQDTIGWIAYRRGDYREALRNLEPAAEELPEDALPQYHLGMTYMALDRGGDARTALTRAIALGEENLPQLDAARAALQELADEG